MDRQSSTRTRRLAVWLLLGGLTGLVLAGCEIADPALPSFTTRLAVPLGEKRIDIADIIEDEDYLIAMDDGTLGFWVSGDPDTLNLDFDLAAIVPAQQVTGALGSFELQIDAGTTFDFELERIWPEATIFDGQEWPVPRLPIDISSDTENLTEIESAHLAAGTLIVSVFNGLPVPVSSDEPGPDRLTLELLDPDTGLPLAIVEFDEIEAGAHAQRTADLADVVLPGRIAVRLAGGSPGSEDAVVIDAQAAISVDAVFSDLLVTEAVAVVPAQSFDTIFSSPLPADYDVMLAVIDEGSLTVTMRNEMAIDCEATVTWPTVWNHNGQVLQLVIDLPGGSVVVREVDFADRIVQAPEGETLDELVATVAVTSDGSGGQAVALRADQGVLAQISGGRIEFASVTGIVPSLSYDLAPAEQNIELPDELDGMELRHATMEITLSISASVPAEVTFDLVGINQAGDERSLQVQEAIEAGEAGRDNTTHIVLHGGNSTIVDFLNHMPNTISLAGGVQLGGPGVQGTLRRGDRAIVSWQITAPLEVVIESTQLFSKPSALDLGESSREMIEDHLGAAQVQLEILNHLPVGVSTRLLLGSDPDLLKDDPLLVIGPVSVDAGNLMPGGGTVQEPRFSRPLIELTQAQTRLLATEGLHSLLEVTLPSTEGTPVRVLTIDYITVQGLIQFDIDVKDTR